MKKTVVCHAVAWCVELDREMTPDEVVAYKRKYPRQNLTFRCTVCQLPLLFQISGCNDHKRPYFKGRMREGHTHCIVLNRREKTQAEVSCQNFEDALSQSFRSCKHMGGIIQTMEKSIDTLEKGQGNKASLLFENLHRTLLKTETTCEELKVLCYQVRKSYDELMEKLIE
jgi:hypothetical protein